MTSALYTRIKIAILLALCSLSTACVGRYQVYQFRPFEAPDTGTEIWRLDTKTGQTCWMHMPVGSPRIEALNHEACK